MKYPNILFLDIETTPNIVASWATGKVIVSPASVIKERRIICICWKWLGKNKVESLTFTDDQNDKEMLEKFIEVYEQADMVVGHNSNVFDIPWIRARLLYHGLPPLPKVRFYDTKKEAQRAFYLNSNRLDYIAKYIGSEGKQSVGYGLWLDILINNSKKALRTMVKYCKQDVLELEKVFRAIYPHTDNTFNIAVFNEDDSICPKCGGELIKKGFAYATSSKKQRYKCLSCGHSPTGGKNLISKPGQYPR